MSSDQITRLQLENEGLLRDQLGLHAVRARAQREA